MSCRHGFANGTCIRCYPSNPWNRDDHERMDPGPEANYGPNMEGPGAVTLEEYQRGAGATICASSISSSPPSPTSPASSSPPSTTSPSPPAPTLGSTLDPRVNLAATGVVPTPVNLRASQMRVQAQEDQALFARRRVLRKACAPCEGRGYRIEGHCLHAAHPVNPADLRELAGAPPDAILARVGGVSTIFESCLEAQALSMGAGGRPVAFSFNDQLVIVRAGDDPRAIARAWWLIAYGEEPEATWARR